MSTAVQIWVRSCLVFVSLFASSVYAQNVAINATGNAPNASALLDLDGTNKGLLIPRVTYCHRVISACPDGMVDGSGNLAAAAQGLLVYQTDGSGDGEGFYYNTSSTTTPAWVKLFGGTPSGGWELTGNAGTTTGTNFLGTTDAVDLAIYTNNTERMRINGETDANEGFIGVNTTTPRSLFHVRETGTGGVSPILANVETYTLGTSLTGFGFSLHPTNKAKASIFFKSLVSGWGRGDMIFALDQGVDWDIVVEADELMRLTNDGDLGIGTSDPGQMLDVAGDVEIGGGAADYDGTDEFLHINSRNQDWYIGVRNLTTANLNDFHIGLTQAEDGIFHIEPGGNVGIGTTTPSSKLHIDGGDIKIAQIATEDPYIIRSYSNSNSLWFMPANATKTPKLVLADAHQWDRSVEIGYNAGTTGAGAGILRIGQISKNSTDFTHGITALYTKGTERIRITNDGDVGIGTSSPSAKLEVRIPSSIIGTQEDRNVIRSYLLHGSGSGTSNLRGAYLEAKSNSHSGTNNIYGSYGRAEQQQGGSIGGTNPAGSVYGQYGHGYFNGNNTSGTGTPTSVLYGVYGKGEFEVNSTGGAMNPTTTIYGVYGDGVYTVTAGSTTPTVTTHGVYGKATGTTAGTQTAIGGYFTATGADNNYAGIFDQGNVGIGTTTPSSLLSVGGNGDAKYNIFSNGTSTTDGATAIRAEQIAPTGFNTSTAIFGKITTFSSGYQYGVRGDVTNGSASTNGRAYGVQGTAGNEDINFGIYGSVTGLQEAAAVFGWDRTGAESDPIPSMATAGNSWAGFFQGNTYVNSNLGIGDLTPASALTVGSGDPFQVNSSGNIVKINNVTYSWPTVQGAAGQVLENDGAGNLTWVTPSGGGSSGTLIFYEDFEGAGTEIYTANTDPLTGLPEWSYETTAGGRLRLAAGASYYKGGSNAATLDREPSGTVVINYLIAEVDLKLYRGSTSLTLDFSYMHHGEENHTNDRVWVRGSNAGLWLQIYDLYANRAANGVWADVTSLDIDATLTAGSQTPSTTFQIRFGQEDNFPSTSITASDGFTFDNITIRGN